MAICVLISSFLSARKNAIKSFISEVDKVVDLMNNRFGELTSKISVAFY
jgi:hypothetical protein